MDAYESWFKIIAKVILNSNRLYEMVEYLLTNREEGYGDDSLDINGVKARELLIKFEHRYKPLTMEERMI